MKDYFPAKWRTILSHNNLDSFDRLWSLEADWFEPPNERRGGWSGVSHFEAELPEGGKINIFRKTQENHRTRTLLHPFGMLTFIREMQVLLFCKKAAVPTFEPVYFAVRKIDGKQRAILCSEALDDYDPLETLVERWLQEGWPDKQTRLRLMKAVAGVMSQMHDHRIQHNCLYPKHIFLRFDEDEISVRLIDLEKAKKRPLRRFATFRDLYTLSRHSQCWRRTDRLRFFLIYLGRKRLDQEAKTLWKRIAKRSLAKKRV